jgi:hypothetical protein
VELRINDDVRVGVKLFRLLVDALSENEALDNDNVEYVNDP